MTVRERVDIKLVLSCNDHRERNFIHQQLTAAAQIQSSLATTAPDLIVVEVRKAPMRLGAFETAFLLGMTISVVVGGTGIGAWCLAHHHGEGGPIKTDSEEGRLIIAAVAPSAEAAKEPTAVKPASSKQA